MKRMNHLGDAYFLQLNNTYKNGDISSQISYTGLTHYFLDLITLVFYTQVKSREKNTIFLLFWDLCISILLKLKN